MPRSKTALQSRAVVSVGWLYYTERINPPSTLMFWPVM